MPLFTVSVLGMDISFRAEADSQRIHDAVALVEDAYSKLFRDGRNVSKEKLLAVVALCLADDYLESQQKLTTLQQRLDKLLKKID